MAFSTKEYDCLLKPVIHTEQIIEYKEEQSFPVQMVNVVRSVFGMPAIPNNNPTQKILGRSVWSRCIIKFSRDFTVGKKIDFMTFADGNEEITYYGILPMNWDAKEGGYECSVDYIQS